MKYIAILFFLLGAVTYLVFPRDWPPAASASQIVYFKKTITPLVTNTDSYNCYQVSWYSPTNSYDRYNQKVVCR